MRNECTVKIILLFILWMFAHFHVYVKLRAKDRIVSLVLYFIDAKMYGYSLVGFVRSLDR